LDKINRVAENLGIDEVMWAAGREHLKKIGQIPADDPGEGEAAGEPEAQADEHPGEQGETIKWMSV
jgi:hypothetical protein